MERTFSGLKHQEYYDNFEVTTESISFVLENMKKRKLSSVSLNDIYKILSEFKAKNENNCQDRKHDKYEGFIYRGKTSIQEKLDILKTHEGILKKSAVNPINPQLKPKSFLNSKENTSRKSLNLFKTHISKSSNNPPENFKTPRNNHMKEVAGEFDLNGSISIVSWNVNGLKSFLKHDDENPILSEFVSTKKIDILCLQETKLQDKDCPYITSLLMKKMKIKENQIIWNCCKNPLKKGQAGTAVIFLNPLLLVPIDSVFFGIGEPEGDFCGRSITILGDGYTLVNLYVPMSGGNLEKLDYRISTWDENLTRYLTGLKSRRAEVPLCVLGDFNVAHKNIDFFYHSKRKKYFKQPGTTPEEQKSFSNILEKCELVDVFRYNYPNNVKFSFFSNRYKNIGFWKERGWRLDYFLVYSQIQRVLDMKTFIEDNINHPYSDHSPIGICLKTKQNK